ncbi:hypothetical protein D3C71_2176610 [compost metagenome]
MERPESHLAGLAVAHEAEEPGLCAEGRYLQIEAKAVCIEPRFAQGFDRLGG